MARGACLVDQAKKFAKMESKRPARDGSFALPGVLSDVSPAAVARSPESAEVWTEGPAWTAVGVPVLIQVVGRAGTVVEAPVLTAAEEPVATRVEELAGAGVQVAPQAGESVAVGVAAAPEPD